MQVAERATLMTLAQLTECQSQSLWLQDAVIARYRQQALTNFLASGLPTRADERWKYAQLAGLREPHFITAKKQDYIQPLPIASLLDAITIVLVDGQLQPAYSDMAALPAGVSVVSLADLSDQQLQYYQQQLALISQTEQPFIQLNIALCNVGFLLYIEADVDCLSPIEIIHLHTQDQVPIQQQAHHLVCLEPGAKAVVFERYQSLSEATYFNNVLLQIDLAKNADLTYYKLQNESRHAHHIANTVVYQQQSSHFSGFLLAEGACYGRDEIDWQLQGYAAEFQWKALIMADQTQQLEIYTRALHRVPQCQSKQEIRTVADDQANVTCHNAIYVESCANQTDAQLQNRNLLLSDQAKVNTKPALEIYHDDVKCSHGATIGRLDESALFYLQTRGLSLLQARAMLLKAFADELLRFVASDTIRQAMSSSMSLLSTAREVNDG